MGQCNEETEAQAPDIEECEAAKSLTHKNFLVMGIVPAKDGGDTEEDVDSNSGAVSSKYEGWKTPRRFEGMLVIQGRIGPEEAEKRTHSLAFTPLKSSRA